MSCRTGRVLEKGRNEASRLKEIDSWRVAVDLISEPCLSCFSLLISIRNFGLCINFNFDGRSDG